MVLMETISVYWYVMDYIGLMLNPIGQKAQNTIQNGIL